MRMLRAGLLSAVFASSAAGLVAQDKPNLSGKWIFDRDDTPAAAKETQLPNGGRRILPESQYKNGNLGPEFTLTHDGKSLKFERLVPNGQLETITYVLDGSETKHHRPNINSQLSADWTSRSSWQGSTLVITSIEEAGAARISSAGTEKSVVTMERKRTLSLNPDGTLVLETTSKSTGRDWQPIVRSIYKKG